MIKRQKSNIDFGESKKIPMSIKNYKGYKHLQRMRSQRHFSKNSQNSYGFTLIEILVVVGIIAVLASVVIVAINPSRQFKLARDSQRLSNVTALLNAVSQNISEHKGLFDCSVSLPITGKIISSYAAQNGLDIADCLVPNYLSALPYDPSKSGAKYNSINDYDTQYMISQDAQGRITASSTGEITLNIAVTR